MDELKDKIILAVKNAIAKNVVFATGDYLYAEIDYDDIDHIAEQVADTLIAAGLKLDTVISHTAEFNHLFVRRINDFELILSSVCDRAEVADRAFDNTMKVFHEILSAMFPDKKIDLDKWKKDNLANAEKELAEVEE